MREQMVEKSGPRLEKMHSDPTPAHLHTSNRTLLQTTPARPPAPGAVTRSAACGPASLTTGPVQAKKGGKDPERALRQQELTARQGPAPSMAMAEFDLSNPFAGADAAPKEENIDIIRKMDWLQGFSMQGQNGEEQNVNLLELAESLREFSSGINDQHSLAALQQYQGLGPEGQTQEAKEALLKGMTSNMKQQYLTTFNALEHNDGFVWDEEDKGYQVEDNRLRGGSTRKTVADKFRHMQYFGKATDAVGGDLLNFSSDKLHGKLGGIRAAGGQFDVLDRLQANKAMYLKYGLGQMSRRDQKANPEYAQLQQQYQALTGNGTKDLRRRR